MTTRSPPSVSLHSLSLSRFHPRVFHCLQTVFLYCSLCDGKPWACLFETTQSSKVIVTQTTLFLLFCLFLSSLQRKPFPQTTHIHTRSRVSSTDVLSCPPAVFTYVGIVARLVVVRQRHQQNLLQLLSRADLTLGRRHGDPV